MRFRILIGAVLLPLVSLTAAAEDWPGWRGPTSQGISAEKNVPVRWSATENVVWMTPIAGQGWSSPIVFGDRVFVTATSPDGVKCHVICLDRIRGSVLWDKEVFEQTPKNKAEKNSYATPTPCTDGRRVYAVFGDGVQIVSGAGDVVQGFDPATGRRLWSVKSEGEGVVPSIVVGGGLIFATSGFGGPTIRAICPGTAENPSAAKVVWEWKKAVPMIPSFVYAGGLLFTINESGVAQCFDAPTGKLLWQQRIGGQHSASPICADGRVYFLSESGDSTIIEAGRQYKLIAKNAVGEKCQASYAVSRGQIFIRTERNLYCIGGDNRGR